MNWQERSEKAEDVLRSLVNFVGAGGYNADKVDADAFEQKIRWGIGQIMERLEKAEAELAQELEAERKRLDWALNHGCVFRPRSERLYWHFVEKLGHSIERTTDPRATIDELIAGDVK